MTTPASLRLILFCLFTVSGFSGLIYESIWSHYLKLVLGHAAYAQTLVLAIFMGGMALGAWLASHYLRRWRNPLRAYALVEGIIGLLAVKFHDVFVWTLDLLFVDLIPGLADPLAIGLCKWGVATALILPQSVLLGMTFPLMSAGILRLFPQRAGATLAVLYFTNSIGAAMGVLASGFWLIPWIGLPGTILTGGLLNVLLAIVVWGLAKGRDRESVGQVRPASGGTAGAFEALVLLAALLTGLASFFYEIGWIRMLTLVLGASTQAFELMLSAFILGLALGGLWIRRRIDRLEAPLRFAGYVQIVMSILALLTLPLYNHTFDIMGFMLAALAPTENGYTLFNLTSHAIALAIMLPATFMAGMTLPLFTFVLLAKGYGERSIGRVYAANTVGAILGVLLATHLVMPAIGTKGLIGLGAVVDAGLGIALLAAARTRLRAWELPAGAGAAALLAVVIFFGVRFDVHRMASGVFRHGHSALPSETEVLYHRDGKTATVALTRTADGKTAIATNGKPDASLAPKGSPPSPDETTMVMLAALPLALHPQAQTVANIGMGSGLTTHTFLGAGTLQRVDTIEIERAMVEGARHFGEAVGRTFSDPRSRITIEDAKTFFSTRQAVYDVIVSEPSNPWVSGVASLFSEEFYERIQGHLAPDGLFVQWLHLYETHLGLVASVFNALSKHFDDYVVFNTSAPDILIVASNGRDLNRPDPWIFAEPALAGELARLGLKHDGDFEARRIGDKALLQPLFDALGVPPNSDYFPYLSYQAPKFRYLKRTALELYNLHYAGVPVRELLENRPNVDGLAVSEQAHFPPSQMARQARRLVAAWLAGTGPDRDAIGSDKLRYVSRLLKLEFDTCFQPKEDEQQLRDALFALVSATTPFLGAGELGPMWDKLTGRPCFAHLSPLTRDWVALHAAVAGRDAEAMARLAPALLDATAEELDQQPLNYLLAAGLGGALATGDDGLVEKLLEKFAARYPADAEPPLDLQLLLVHARSNNIKRSPPRQPDAAGVSAPAAPPDNPG